MHRAASDSPAFFEIRNDLRAFGDDGDCCHAWTEHSWWKTSILKAMINNYDEMTAIPGMPQYAFPLQKKAELALRRHHHQD
eukprot:4975308-Pyramimonas_sp.AAC.1